MTNRIASALPLALLVFRIAGIPASAGLAGTAGGGNIAGRRAVTGSGPVMGSGPQARSNGAPGRGDGPAAPDAVHRVFLPTVFAPAPCGRAGGPLAGRLRVVEVPLPAKVQLTSPHDYFSRERPIMLAPGGDGTYRIGWTDASGKAHVTKLGLKDQRIGQDTVLDGEAIRGLVANDGGFTALLRKGEYMHLARYLDEGRPVFAVRLVGGEPKEVVGSKWIDSLHESRLAWSGQAYAAYFSHTQRHGDGVAHQGDLLRFFDGSGGRMEGGWEWGCSHNLDTRLAWNGAAFGAVCLSDPFPHGIQIWSSFGGGSSSLVRQEPKAFPDKDDVTLGGLVPVPDGFWMSFTSPEGRDSSDVGVVRVGNSAEVLSRLHARWADGRGAQQSALWSVPGATDWLPAIADDRVQDVPLAWYGRACLDASGNPTAPAQDVRGRVALIERGDCTFYDKVTSARRQGAAAAIVFADDRPWTTMGCGEPSDCARGPGIPAVMVGRKDGTDMLRLVQQGTAVTVTFRDPVRWLTHTPSIKELAPHLARYGSDLLAAWQGDGRVMFTVVDANGAVVKGPEALPVELGAKDDLANLANGDAGWAFAGEGDATLRVARIAVCDQQPWIDSAPGPTPTRPPNTDRTATPPRSSATPASPPGRTATASPTRAGATPTPSRTPLPEGTRSITPTPATGATATPRCQSITPGRVATHVLNASQPVVRYCAQLSNWTSFRVFARSGQLDPRIDVFTSWSPNPRLLASNDDGEGVRPNAFLAYRFVTSTYWIEVSRVAATSGTFAIRMDEGQGAAVGDVNLDCVVDQTDEAMVSARLGAGRGGDPADLNLDDRVDASDLRIVQSNRGLRCR